ncbi:hypothetical protein CAEBREN_30002 [Caenorhabditis brenneri]|uniref:DUF7808 domain-containing protein n=1 Tax=Caenorhabditis brenneri TaxID=135651 RepID=G0MJ36_CAEBE|nr:hypothetical protein CAEBREN_30002 [Caenorhabditis brenneri]
MISRTTAIVSWCFLVLGVKAQEMAETREYACTRQSSRASKSECMLRFGELSAINDNGCFMHFDAEKQESIELCPLQCQRFNEATILKTSDSLICSPGVAVGVERRQSDWFMWRSAPPSPCSPPCYHPLYPSIPKNISPIPDTKKRNNSSK